MDRAWQATVHSVTKSWTRLKQLSTHAPMLHNATKDKQDWGEGGNQQKKIVGINMDFCETELIKFSFLSMFTSPLTPTQKETKS